MFLHRARGPTSISSTNLCRMVDQDLAVSPKKKESHVMYCPLPQYEAKLWMGGDPGGV